MRFLAWEMLTTSSEFKNPQERKTDRFGENRMSLGQLSFRGPMVVLSQNSLNTYKVKTPDFGKSDKKLSRKGTTQEKKRPEMNVLSP